MSGLEPLVALGLACNILQLIEVGCNTIKLAKNVYQSSSPVIDQTLQDNAAVLNTISSEVKAAKRPASLPKLDQQLVTTADKCYAAARDLEEEVIFLLSHAKQNKLAAAMKVVAKTTWRKRRLDRLKDGLENAEKLMTKTLLAQVWSRTGAAQLDLGKVKDDLGAFIQEYRNGNRDIKQLASSESLMTRDHISASSKRTIEAIDGVQKQMLRMTVEADVQVDQAQRERLLRSLKFPAFNDRRNQVSKAHESTFEWIFIGDDGPMQGDLKDLDLADLSETRWDLFSNWLSSTADVYWISGKLGSGKTTLVKYVLNHPRTITHLNIWSPGALIVSHYFWRPGNPMQQNIKGLLCSLLYQLLDKSLAAARYVLQDIQARSLGTKDSDTDWSVPELRSTLLHILSSYEHPVCMFIDGLDELHPSDGPLELLDLLLQFTRCRNVKLCLASRPEPILEERLSAYPHLRVQDLTRSDLERYAQDHLKLTGSTFGEALLGWAGDSRDPIQLLVDKAEGVFLWLVLATKSINKGFTYADTADMIRQRIQSLPGDLTRLYKDMWNRACQDNPVAYRQIAAKYLRLQVVLNHGDPEAYPSFMSSSLHLMLASTSLADQILEAIEDPSNLVPEGTLLKHCRVVERGLRLYCFGLIETTPVSAEDDVVGWYGSQYSTLWYRYGRKKLHFIHRTAQDFLLDTADGAEILSHDPTTEISLFFAWARGHLAISQLFAGDLSPMTSYISDYVALFDDFPRQATNSGDPERSRTLVYLEKLCHSGQLLSNSSHVKGFKLCGGVNYLKATAKILDEFILSRPRISTLSKATISEILLNITAYGPHQVQPVQRKDSADPLILILLSEGADPNSPGMAWYTRGYYGSSEFSDVRTPFSEYLNTMVWDLRTWREVPLARKMRNLHSFLSHSAKLDDMLYQVLHRNYDPRSFDFASCYWERSVERALAMWEHGSGIASTQGRFLILAFPASTVVKLLLEQLGTETEHLRHGEDSEYGDMMSFLARNREYLDNWSKWEDIQVIGRLGYQENEDSNKNLSAGERIWYVPNERDQTEITKELVRELEKRFLCGGGFSSVRTINQLVHEVSWSPRATGLRETYKSLIQLGIIAKRDDEIKDLQQCVEEFQEGLYKEKHYSQS